MKMKLLASYMARSGLLLNALAPEVDKLDAVPEFQRPWYAQDAATGKFKLDFAKVDVEDVTGLRNTVKATRQEVADAKAAAKKAVEEALAPYKDLGDVTKLKELMAQFEDADEAKLIAQGKAGIDQIIARRIAKREAELLRQVEEANNSSKGALEVASTFMERVLDNHIRAAAAETPGFHKTAINDALLHGRNIFSVDDDGNAVQFDEDGETPVMGKDGKTPFSVKEWLESKRADCPHWFAAGGSGGGSQGDKGGKGGNIPAGLSPQQRMTMARAQQGRK